MTGVLQWLTAPEFRRATFGGAQRGNKIAAERVVVRPVELREGRRIQVSRFDGRKDVSTNHAVADVLGAGFANVHVATATEEIDLRLTKKGKVLVSRKKAEGEQTSMEHNRVKETALPEGLHGGAADRLLLAMGIVDRHGSVKPTMRAKFTQINEFLKLLGHVLGEVAGDSDRALTILDCGCGASHLTLVAAYWLNEVKGIKARVVGVDVNAEVIEKARERAGKLGCDYLEFRTGKIGGLEGVAADIVLALHACDTATDDALAQGVKSGATLILAVPCCHRNLNDRLQVASLVPIHRQGILHERLADIATDTFRALLLKVAGYRAEVMEFISPEHTARNLMIRAVKVREAGDREAMREYEAFKAFVGAEPYLARLILPSSPPA